MLNTVDPRLSVLTQTGSCSDIKKVLTLKMEYCTVNSSLYDLEHTLLAYRMEQFT